MHDLALNLRAEASVRLHPLSNLLIRPTRKNIHALYVSTLHNTLYQMSPQNFPKMTRFH